MYRVIGRLRACESDRVAAPLQRQLNKRIDKLPPGKQKNAKKMPALRIASWNVRTMRPGLSNDLQQINDSRKTAIIDSELDRLNIDIATVQETRLAENGSLKSNDTHSSGKERVLKRNVNMV